MIKIDTDGIDDYEIVNGNFVNDNDVEVDAEGKDFDDNAEEVEEKEGGKTSKKADDCDSEHAEVTKEQCEEEKGELPNSNFLFGFAVQN